MAARVPMGSRPTSSKVNAGQSLSMRARGGSQIKANKSKIQLNGQAEEEETQAGNADVEADRRIPEAELEPEIEAPEPALPDLMTEAWPNGRGRKEKKKGPKKHPQDLLKQLWKNYEPEYHGKITQILPDSVPTSTSLPTKPKLSQNTSGSYQEARTRCERAVKMIVAECIAMNQKYTDPHFDLERDLKVTYQRNCLKGLVGIDEYSPADVKRVTELYENPQFFADGTDYDDVMQGALGDCWVVSALSILGTNQKLLEKVCVIQDQEVGIYGFVFYRDGEWHPTIIDDQLYLSNASFDEGANGMLASWGKDEEQKYLELFQRGSKALYFARCRDDNETWVPLLEKAFAKAHGGYDALSGGQTGEAIEDFTGGVTTEIYTTNILNKNKFWDEDLSKIGTEFLFDGGDAMFREWQKAYEDSDDGASRVRDKRRQGLYGRHAYAVLGTYEGFGERLVKVRNPWGRSEWTGPWADGSSKWTAEWLERVGHTFGDDGIFWMSYKDFLSHFKHLNRTRIFDDSWYTAQKWATMQIPFNNLSYQTTKFTIDVPNDTQVIVVLSQLDDRYFAGLAGRFSYTLQFRISMSDNEDEYIARSKANYELSRSTNVELFLTQGKYTVLVKVHATDYGDPSPEEVIRDNLPERKEKIMTIGRLYDLAHQKGLPDPDEINAEAAESKSAEDEVSEHGASPDISNKEINSMPVAMEASGSGPRPIPVVIVAPQAEGIDSEDEEEDEKQPWNASCVVGLRVYSKLPDVSVGVIWPPIPKPDTVDVTTPVLDRDAITKAPQEEAEKNVEKTENGSGETLKAETEGKEQVETGDSVQEALQG